MKKSLLLILVLVFLLSGCGCAAEKTAEPAQATTVPTTEEPVEEITEIPEPTEEPVEEILSEPELTEEGNLDERLLLVVVEEYQRAVGGIAGIHGEVHRVAEDGGPKGIGAARAQFQSLVLMCGEDIDSMHIQRNYRNP